jgi:hypothetical protein
MDSASQALNLTPAQINRLNQATQQIQARYRYAYNQLGSLNGAARSARLQELNQQYALDWNVAAGNIFNDQQRNRYRQLNYQYGGFNSLYDPAVQKRLNLNADQLRNLRANVDWSNQQLQNINGVGSTDAARGMQMYNAYWKAYQDRLNRYLTPAQQRAWRDMTGEPVTFQPTFAPPR